MNGPVHLWTRPSDQGEPFGAYGQAVDNTAVLPTACPHSRPSRPQDTQAQNALRLYNAMNGLRESRQGDRTTQRTNTKQGQASPKELGGKTKLQNQINPQVPVHLDHEFTLHCHRINRRPVLLARPKGFPYSLLLLWLDGCHQSLMLVPRSRHERNGQ